ncbi:hypothetical protein NPIL_153991 [Nephila pilipes]|uniref:Uncharacterized protein n=1 Tax=Nephila pilipes TaxID=299642 RepID=A0A8X6QYF3_NEPPI|nr:hypothetical protein NPIL_153991 [Nephila pilipes]
MLQFYPQGLAISISHTHKRAKKTRNPSCKLNPRSFKLRKLSNPATSPALMCRYKPFSLLPNYWSRLASPEPSRKNSPDLPHLHLVSIFQAFLRRKSVRLLALMNDLTMKIWY